MNFSFKLIQRVRARLTQSRGVSSVEYATLLSLIAIVLIPVISSLGSGVAGSFDRVNNAFLPPALSRTQELNPGQVGSGTPPELLPPTDVVLAQQGGGTLDNTPGTTSTCQIGKPCSNSVGPRATHPR